MKDTFESNNSPSHSNPYNRTCLNHGSNWNPLWQCNKKFFLLTITRSRAVNWCLLKLFLRYSTLSSSSMDFFFVAISLLTCFQTALWCCNPAVVDDWKKAFSHLLQFAGGKFSLIVKVVGGNWRYKNMRQQRRHYHLTFDSGFAFQLLIHMQVGSFGQKF